MIEINELEEDEFKVLYPHICNAIPDDQVMSPFALAVKQAKQATWASADWQDYNFFSGVVVDIHRDVFGNDRYQVLPKSLAVSLFRALDYGTASRDEIYEKFKDVVWTLVPF